MDDQGFCWGCGVDDAKVVYGQVEKIVKKFKLKVFNG